MIHKSAGDDTVVATQYVQNAPSLAMSYTPLRLAYTARTPRLSKATLSQR